MSDLYEYKKFINSSRQKLNQKRIDLGTIRESNKRYESTKDKYERITEVRGELEVFVKLMNVFLTSTKAEENRFRSSRKEFLEKYIDRNLNDCFPTRHYESKITFDTKYQKQRAFFSLNGKSGNLPNVKMGEGKFIRQLISFSASISISECLGRNKMYLDEAFNASDADNLKLVSIMLKSLVNKGFQIIIIEHDEEVYKDIPRREIRLYSDLNETVDKIDIKDF